MDYSEDTPASPVPDHDWDNSGAITPEHIGSDHGDGNGAVSDDDNRPESPKSDSGNKSAGNDSDQEVSGKKDKEVDSDQEEEEEEELSPRKKRVALDSDDSDDDEPIVAAKKRKTAARIEDSSDEGERNDEDDGGEKEEKDEDSDGPSPTKRKAAIVDDSSDEKDDDEDKGKDDEAEKQKDNDDEAVEKMMGDIFGEDESDDDQEDRRKQRFGSDSDSDDDLNQVKRKRSYSGDEEERPRHRWDFDEMMAQKKAERKKTRKRKRDGGIDLISDNDDQIKSIVDQMTRAAAQDRTLNENRQPAFQKHKLLPIVRQTLLKQDLFEVMLDNGMMSAVSDWLAPLPDKSLPSLEIRTTLLKILSDFPNLEQGVLRQSGLGKAVMYLLKHPREVKENKLRATRLIREWSRPIFQLDSDYSSMTREERVELDNSLNRKRRPGDEPSSSRQVQRRNSNEESINPGQVGFISRARVPRPSTKTYINRPRSNVEGQFHGASKARATARFDMAQREFKNKTKQQKARRHIGPSIAGNKMEI